MENLLYESGDLKLVLPSLSATENLQNLLSFFEFLISNFAFWRSFASKFYLLIYLFFKTLVPNLSLAWQTTNRVQSCFFVSSASADIAGLGRALLLGLEAGCHPLQTKLILPV
jgi:hypothetical protein